MKFGFEKDKDNSEFENVFKDGTKLKDVYVDIYTENPLAQPKKFMLLSRMIEKNVTVLNDNDRFILLKNDKFNTYITNILKSEIFECFYVHNENHFEFILNINNTYYEITVFN